jgi:hypothetical protein
VCIVLFPSSEHHPVFFKVLKKMAQVPKAVSAQVLAETQKLARRAKEFSCLTNAQIEAKLEPFEVITDKDGSNFSELLNGKKSKIHKLTEFHKALKKAGLLPPEPEPDSQEAFEKMFYGNPDAKTLKQTNWQAESNKVAAFKKARTKAAAALNELAAAMDHPAGKMYFSLLQNFRLKQDSPTHCADGAEIARKMASASDQIRELATFIGEMSVMAASGWDYSNSVSGAKVVQLKPTNEDKSRRTKTTKKTKNL